MSDVERYAVWIAAVAAGVAGLLYLLRLGWRALIRSIRGGKRAVATVHRLGDALLGDPETGKPSMPERLDAVDERLARIDGELHPNGGGSLCDAVNRTEAGLASLRAEFAAHLAEHNRNPVTVNVGQVPNT